MSIHNSVLFGEIFASPNVTMDCRVNWTLRGKGTRKRFRRGRESVCKLCCKTRGKHHLRRVPCTRVAGSNACGSRKRAATVWAAGKGNHINLYRVPIGQTCTTAEGDRIRLWRRSNRTCILRERWQSRNCGQWHIWGRSTTGWTNLVKSKE